MANESPRLRLSILGIVAVSLFGALFARLWYLQVMAAPEYQVQVQANSVRTISEEAPRGRILDAKGRVLVDNRTSLVVTVNPHDLAEVSDRGDVELRLAEALTRFGVPTKVATIERRINDKQYDPLQPVPVAIDVPEELDIYLSERSDEFPSVAVTRQSVRTYPQGTLAAHVLGYVGRISSDELAAKKDDAEVASKPYQPNSDVGKSGVERSYEDDLRGTPGITKVEVDAQGRVVRTLSQQPPTPGNDIVLTIDLDVQRMAEQALAQQLEAVRGSKTRGGPVAKAPAGATVVTDPRSGNIVALASYPTYDPSEFVNGISQARYDQLTSGAESDNPLVDRAVQGLYAPGSTFKPFTAYAALTAGLIDRTSTKYDDGVYEKDDRPYKNAGSQPHGNVNVTSALTVSSDWFFYWLGDRFYSESGTVGDHAQQDAYLQFGFGTPTGAPLASESAGTVPDAAWKRKLWESFTPQEQANGDPTWYPGDNMLMAIGQGYMLVTPMQLDNAYATLANGGTVHQPNLLLRVLSPVKPDGSEQSVVREVAPVVERQIPMPASVRDPIVQGLEGVTSSPRGTAYATFQGFDLSSFPVAGKTGTAQVEGKADTSVFAAFGPANDPQYAVVAFLEQSGYGADAAAPVVRRILEQVSGQTVTNPQDIKGGGE